MDRRQLLAWAAGTAVAMTLPGIGQAQTFPSKPVRLVVPQAGGTGNDVLARALAEKLALAWKQPVVVENKPGANGTLAIGYVLGQPADGHTLFFAGVSNLAFNPFLYPKLPYNPTRDLTGVANARELAIRVRRGAVAQRQHVPGLRAHGKKAHPGEISFASGGIGNSTHLAMELVAERTGIRMQHVPFNGTGGATSLMSGQTPVMMNVIAGVQPFFASKKLVPLAVTGDKRLPALPAVPTFKELGYDVQVPGWYAIVARAGTPASVVQQVNADINHVLDDPGFKEKLGYQFLDPIKGPPSEVRRYMKRDADTWGPIIRRLNISL
ncbi:Bug family tripartite tricarboxylate transporter substrate binding protein [Cupriavidus basilensis]